MVVEGPLTNLLPTMMQFPPPRVRASDRDKVLHLHALSALQQQNPVLPPWAGPIMQGYAAAGGGGGGGGGHRRRPTGSSSSQGQGQGPQHAPMDSRYDPRYQQPASAGGAGQEPEQYGGGGGGYGAGGGAGGYFNSGMEGYSGMPPDAAAAAASSSTTTTSYPGFDSSAYRRSGPVLGGSG